MSLTLHFHPLSSFCWKTLIALYENDTPFTANMVDLGNPVEREALLRLSPIGRFPVLEDTARQAVVPESSVIIEYLDRHYPGRIRFIPAEPEAALQTRLRDRFLDLYIHLQMQKIVGDRLRPKGSRDPHGVEQARAQIQKSYDILEQQLAGGAWAMGESFGLADCAAAPTLFYAGQLEPFGERKNVAAYLARLKARPSFARVLKEAEPYFAMFPKEDA
ncbi:glutathione S-transferase family protein [Bradyrhizobium lablabi]|uniref:glutathione S-transferase family protein n=1 Tax=Bradyrhizobium lablabi TaxID=722472 RepID=UPI001BA70291|nr:glutathione S-transferase family protein [Bradyrhizobium lablabi]MBR1122742.1 glutathione S-transferase family protein [Bradyrhizobium lablabi]